MQGLNWVALTPREPLTVQLEGEKVLFTHPELPPRAAAELQWLWSALTGATRAQSLAVFYRGARVMQAGVAPAACDVAQQPELGPIIAQALQSGTANYFANLALYPGRFEFFTYMPVNSQARLTWADCARDELCMTRGRPPSPPCTRQAVVVQPLGSEGVLVAASGTQRGFTTADQRWLALLAQKLDSTLDATFRVPPPKA